MRSRALWVQKKICNYCCRRPSQVYKARLKTLKWRRRNRCVFPHVLSSCASAIVGLVACSPLLAAHIAILTLTRFQVKVVDAAFKNLDKVDRLLYLKKNIIANEMDDNVLPAVVVAVVSFYFAYLPTCLVVRNLTLSDSEAWPILNSADVRPRAPPRADGDSLVCLGLQSICVWVITLPWLGLMAACVLCYRMNNFDSRLESAVKGSTAYVVHKCYESVSINSTAMVNCSDMTAAFNITTQAFSNATSINSTAAMACTCDMIVASEVCIDYLKSLLQPYVQPLLLLSIVHIILLVPLPALMLASIMSYLYKRLILAKPVNPAGELRTTSRAATFVSPSEDLLYLIAYTICS